MSHRNLLLVARDCRRLRQLCTAGGSQLLGALVVACCAQPRRPANRHPPPLQIGGIAARPVVPDSGKPRKDRRGGVRLAASTREGVRETVRANLNAVRQCYAKYLESPATLGRITLRLTVSVDGRVNKASVVDPLGRRSAADCARRTMSRWRFSPLGAGAGPLTIEYPLLFR